MNVLKKLFDFSPKEVVPRPQVPVSLSRAVWPLPLQQEHVEGCRMFADREGLIRFLKQYPHDMICEIGVEFGFFSDFLLKELQPKRFDAYDLFDLHHYEHHGARKSADLLKGRTHLEYYRDKLASYADRCEIETFEGDSSRNLSSRPDAFYDLIYIDGDHTIDGAAKDTEQAVLKVKPNGTLVFNDYIMWDCINWDGTAPKVTSYGVVQAANELCVNHGWRMIGFALHGSMFCDVALRKTI